jgi:hypothetical protein
MMDDHIDITYPISITHMDIRYRYPNSISDHILYPFWPCNAGGDLSGEHMWRTVRSRLGIGAHMGEDIDSSDKWQRGERYD